MGERGIISRDVAAAGGYRRDALVGESVEGTEAFGFVVGYLGFVLLDVADFVDTGEEAVLGEGVDFELDFGTAGPGEDLGFYVDVYGQVRISGEGVAELLVDFAADD